ncbi:hypothetical protein JTE90_009848 [Oedothorax gibbosus]|uniref:Uncharacterized protein n=1 Tax=Oedothorax gibbosus TaxID=931172 RepID=A0AAV6U0X0_9ARAC|nr:hypothetical protein JTE90_009848 [Oedothorax gibbosus]
MWLVNAVKVLWENVTSNALKKTIHRVRTKENHVPVAPESLQQLALPPTYSCSEKGDNFLLMIAVIWRKIQQLGLQVRYARYASDGDFALEIRLLAALAFMSVDVISSFEMISEMTTIQNATLVPLLDYFEDTWIGRLLRNGLVPAPVLTILHYGNGLSSLKKNNL